MSLSKHKKMGVKPKYLHIHSPETENQPTMYYWLWHVQQQA